MRRTRGIQCQINSAPTADYIHWWDREKTTDQAAYEGQEVEVEVEFISSHVQWLRRREKKPQYSRLDGAPAPNDTISSDEAGKEKKIQYKKQANNNRMNDKMQAQ